jgi:serralysin
MWRLHGEEGGPSFETDKQVGGTPMAVLTLSPFVGLDMSLGIMARGELIAVLRRGTAEHSFAYVDDFGAYTFERLRGSDFQYDRLGDLRGGRVTEIDRIAEDGSGFTLTGLDVSVPVVMDFVLDNDVEGELAHVFRGDDSMVGSDAADVLIGMGGRDELLGYGGFDDLYGEDGHDSLRGGDGDDYLDGGAGHDDLHGNQGFDTLLGAFGDDLLLGGRNADDLFGEEGADFLNGNLGDDLVVGGEGFDTVRGGQGFDSLSGGPGDDWLSGDLGADTMAGGPGADVFFIWGEAGADRVRDFNVSEGDRVQIAAGSSFSLSQVGADAVVQVGGAQLVLIGVQASALPPGSIFLA